jgi:hypothetical protein
MNKEFTPYQEALELKELGFNKPCLGYYFNKQLSFGARTSYGEVVEAPTYSQAFGWFREKYDLFVAPSVISYESDPYLWFFEINSIVLPFGTDLGETSDFKTYEEAELACLIKLIEIVKKNK